MKIVFVSDYFADTFKGGAEMATEAIIEGCPHEHVLILAEDLTHEAIEQHKDAYFVFGNFSMVKTGLLLNICDKIRYSVIEFDYKLCPLRNPEYYEYRFRAKPEVPIAEVATFFRNADRVFFMSEAQKRWALTHVPEIKGVLLSSPFTMGELATIRSIMAEPEKPRKGNLITFSKSWVKGSRETIRWAISRGIEYQIMSGGLEYKDVLQKFKECESYIYLPAGCDTCPRAVIEAKVLGAKIIINSYVQHHDEPWFDTPDHEVTMKYLEGRVSFFWEELNGQIQNSMARA